MFVPFESQIPHPYPPRWKSDMAVTCYQGSHAVLAYAVGIPGLILVAFFMPVATAWHLARHKYVGIYPSSM